MKRYQNNDNFSRQANGGEDETREDGGRGSFQNQRGGGRSNRGGYHDGNKSESYANNFYAGAPKKESSEFDRGQRDRGGRETNESNVWNAESSDGGGYKARQVSSENTFSHRSNNFDSSPRGAGGNSTWNNGGNQRRSNFSSDVPPRFQNQNRGEDGRHNSREEGSENGRPFYQRENQWGSESGERNRTRVWNSDENRTKSFSNNSRDERSAGGRNDAQRGTSWNNSEENRNDRGGENRSRNNFNGGRDRSGVSNDNVRSEPYKPPHTWNNDESKSRNYPSNNSYERGGRSDNQRSSWNKDESPRPSWNKDENSKPSWNRDENSRPSWNKDENSKPSWNKDENSRPSWNKDENSKPSWNKDEGGRNGGCNYNSNRNDNQKGSWNRDFSSKNARPETTTWNSSKTNDEVSWESATVQASPGTEVSEVKVEVGDYKEISVIHVITPDEFYCNLVDFKSHALYRDMSEKLNLVCGETGGAKNLEKREVGAFCAACFSEDQAWYRAKILSIDGAQAEVFFIDYGNTDWSALDSLKALEAELVKLPARAIKCALFDVAAEEAEWTDDEAVHFEDIVTRAHYLARFLQRNQTKDGFVVDMVDSFLYSDLSLRLQLMKERAIMPRSTSDEVYSQLASSSLSTQASFSHVALEVGAKLKTYVSWVNFPGEFYARDLSAEAAWSAFDAKLTAEYAALGPHELALTKLEKDSPCVTPFVYHGAKGWYRSLILAVENEHVVVFYVDYGNVERVKFADVKSIKIEYMKLPAQAILLNVANLKPLGTHWKSVSQAELGKYLAGDLECEVKAAGERSYVVDVRVDEQDVATRMIEDGLAYFEEGHSCSASDAVRAVIDRIVASSQTKIVESPALSTENTSSVLTPVEETLVESSPSSNDKPIVECTVENVTETNPDLDESSIGSSGIVLGSKFSAGVSFVTGVNSFYVQRESDFDLIDDIVALLSETFAESEAEEQVKWKVGEVCVARYEQDQCWYRALILEQRDFGFQLLFVDYGNVEFVTFDQIRSVPASWADTPGLALRCRLNGLEGTQEQLKEALNEIFEAAEMNVDVFVKGMEMSEGSETIFLVDLTCAEADVAKQLKNKFGIAEIEEVTSSVPQLGEAPTADPGKLVNAQAAEFVLGEKFEVCVCFIVSPERFWLQKVSDAGRLETLLVELGESCCKSEEYGEKLEGRLSVGDLCAVKFSVDDGWYRGEVEGLAEEGANVFFVDFGNSEVFENGSARVQKLEKEEWRNEAFFAVQCQLKAPEGGWSAEAQDLFKSNYDSKNCLAECLERKSDGVYVVRLLDMGLDVAKEISSSGEERKSDDETKKKEDSEAKDTSSSFQKNVTLTADESSSFNVDSSSMEESSSNANDCSSSMKESSNSVNEISSSVDTSSDFVADSSAIVDSSDVTESSDSTNECSVKAGRSIILSSTSSDAFESPSEITEVFNKGLVVPSYDEFAESASTHPRSESPMPSNTLETETQIEQVPPLDESVAVEQQNEIVSSKEEENDVEKRDLPPTSPSTLPRSKFLISNGIKQVPEVMEGFIADRLALHLNDEKRKKVQSELSTDFDKEGSEVVAESDRETENSSDDVGEEFLTSKGQVPSIKEPNGQTQSTVEGSGEVPKEEHDESDDSSTLENTSADLIEDSTELLEDEDVVVVLE